MTKEVIEAYELFEGVQTFSTLWEWSERFVRNGFRVATADFRVLQRAWKIEVEANEGDFAWYPDMESMRYCFYVKPDAPSPGCSSRLGATAIRRKLRGRNGRKRRYEV